MKVFFPRLLQMPHSQVSHRAFTLFETLAVVALLGIVSLSAITVISGIRDGAQEKKLRSDVNLLNRAVVAYLGANGNLESTTSADQVLCKLKLAACANSGPRILGFRGSFIDPKLSYEPQSDIDSAAGKARAIWDTTSLRFVIRHDGPAGIRGFYIDPANDNGIPEAVESRDAFMDLAVEDTWIWDYADRTLPSASGPASGIVVSSFPTTPPPTASTPQPRKKKLSPPSFSIPSSSRPVTDFDLAVLFADSNDPGIAEICFSIDYGEWQLFDGSPATVPPGGVLKAQAVPRDTDAWYPSSVIEHTYTATPVQLEIPAISSSESSWRPGVDSSVISISQTNDEALARIVYQIDGGGWNDYDAPFTLTSVDYPAGASIVAKAIPLREYYLESGTASFTLIGEPVKLDPPQIEFSANAFSDDKNDPVTEISVRLNNVNPLGSSIVSYQIVPVPGGIGATTAFMDYTGPFTIKQAFYPSGFGIRAYVKPLESAYEASDEVTRYASTVQGVFGGHLDLDTTIVRGGRYYSFNVQHTHDYTGKYDLDTVDFFSLLESKQIEIDEGISSRSQRFKILLVNGNLSPGMRIIIEREKGDKTERISLPVTEYDDIPVSDLPVYSLDGVGDTYRLVGFEARFGEDVITTAGALPTNPSEVIKNEPGKNNEWRNGALTFQAVSVSDSGVDRFGTTTSLSNGGVHGVATSGLLWEGMLYWHWDGKSYDDSKNQYRPGDPASVEGYLTSPDLSRR